MNKVLAEKVKAKCKDMGLSEEFINGITASLGTDITDDSTDNEAIEAKATLIAEIAKQTQGEGNRYVESYKKNHPQLPPKPPKTEDDGGEEPAWATKFRQSFEDRIQKLEDKNKELIAEQNKTNRTSKIVAAFDKHNIPSFIREYVSVPETVMDNKIDEFVGGMAQKFITEKLPQMDTTGRQVASKEETQAAADAFFKAHVKQETN